MQFLDFSFVLLIISTLLCLFLIHYSLKKKPCSQIQKLLAFILICTLDICLWLIIQKACYTFFGINPVYFEPLVYLGTCACPVAFLLLAISFVNTKVNFTKKYWLLFVIPIITIFIIITNDYHHLFYKVYSFNLNEMIYGPYMYIHIAYTYILFIIGFFMMITHTAKNSGFFSKQSLLIVIGILLPVVVNILGFLNIIEANVYVTPISFSFAILLIAFAIYKFNFLSITPIALEKVVDRMSDSYVVLNDQNVIIDFNKSFLSVFKEKEQVIRNTNILNWNKSIYLSKLKSALRAVSLSSKTVSFEAHFDNINKYFNIEVSSIVNKGMFLGTLILFKDITQHIADLETIRSNQDMLIEKERFASLGQMIGGIAHNLKTPIMSIAGATEALTDLITEYDSSIGDNEVTPEDHHEIAKDMSSWVSKIKTHTSYMSDVITAVKGQAVETTDNISSEFTIEELIKRVNILMKHELKHSLVELNINMNVDKDFTLHGDINCLVQVINNLISNAIQSYNGAPDNKIDFSIFKDASSLIFDIQDYGCGMSKDVQNKLFKQMITTKGKNGTGLGLFMSYSNIRAHFNGTIKFQSEVNKGTKFSIIIPCE